MIVRPPPSLGVSWLDSLGRFWPGSGTTAGADTRASGRGRSWKAVTLVAAVFLMAVGAVAFVVRAHGAVLLSLGAMTLAGTAILTLRWTPGLLVAVFLLFTNLPVVAAQQGLVSRAVALLVGLLFVPALAHHLVAREQGLRVDRTFGLMAAFLGAMLLSSFAAVEPGLALRRVGVFAMEGLAIYLLVFNTVRDLSTLRRVLGVLVVAASLLAGMAAYQAGTGSYGQDFGGLAQVHDRVEEGAVDPAQREHPGTAGRVRGPVDDPNRFAQVLLLVAPFALLGWLRGRRTVLRAASAGATLLILGGVLLTYSRGAFLTLAGLVVLLGVFRYVRPWQIAAAALVAALMIPQLVPGYLERIETIAGAVGLFADDVAVEPDAVTRGRTTEMLAALLTFREHPVVGVGPGQYMPHYSVQYQLRPEIRFRELAIPRRAHNLYAEVAAETGAVGLFIFFAIPAFLTMDLWRLREELERRRPELEWIAGAFALSILSYLGTGVFLHLAYERYYWFFLALAAAAVAVLRSKLDAADPRGFELRRRPRTFQ